ncbi:protein kinase domain-containing protein [Candidatus Chloroploca asiatica]|uniref:non-specific serine/threonine protein kinase n=1 Tax=Candidatus Chloroploca asiatica TaxID=1506545 RepID=A0A2H3KJM6_9CHLR|nr:protein kinase [Candidatus Chloroploca asiatica]PDV98102.1 hypothetical protein A9Q02_03205 [Candidatus Chloroploca asiatica]
MKTYPRGTHIGPYEILSLLPAGKGGMGAVYLARPRPKYAGSSPPLVALKMAYGSHNDFLKYEVEHMERMSHPHVLRVLPIPNAGTNQGRPIYIAKAEPKDPKSPYYIVVEYMQGGSVEQLLQLRKHLSPAEGIEITNQVAEALIHIHSHQIVHLDIKDSNILLRNRLSRWSKQVPQVVVSDFGIAWSTERRQLPTVYGSQFYTAPERAAGGDPHPRNDVFSLGVLLYEMLVGRTPFTSVVVPGTRIMEHSRPTALNRNISPELERVMLRALATEPAQRYQSVQEFKADLDRVQGLPRPGRVKVPLLQDTREYLIAGLSSTAVLMLIILLTAVGVNAAANQKANGGASVGSTEIVLTTMTAEVGVTVISSPVRATATKMPVPSDIPVPVETRRPTSTTLANITLPTERSSAPAPTNPPGQRATSTTIPATTTSEPTSLPATRVPATRVPPTRVPPTQAPGVTSLPTLVPPTNPPAAPPPTNPPAAPPTAAPPPPTNPPAAPPPTNPPAAPPTAAPPPPTNPPAAPPPTNPPAPPPSEPPPTAAPPPPTAAPPPPPPEPEPPPDQPPTAAPPPTEPPVEL